MSRSRSGFPNVWPVVADFFLALLAVLVFVEARAGRPDPTLPRQLHAIQEKLDPLVRAEEIKEARIEYPQATVVFSDHYLSFPQCGWELSAEKAAQVRNVLDVFAPVAPFISALNIEGHADKRRPTNCRDERTRADGSRVVVPVRTNFELSQRRALSVYAALLNVPTDDVEDDAAFDSSQVSLVRTLRERHRVLVAGYGDTRPWPNTPDPLNDAHRRVEIKFTFCRRASDVECTTAGAAAPAPVAAAPIPARP